MDVIEEKKEWRQLIVSEGIKELFRKRYFDICLLRSLCETLSLPTGGRAWSELNTLHCVDFRDIHPEILRRLPVKVLEYLNPFMPLDEVEKLASAVWNWEPHKTLKTEKVIVPEEAEEKSGVFDRLKLVFKKVS